MPRTGPPRTKFEGVDTLSEHDAVHLIFGQFLDTSMLNTIVRCTNIYAAQVKYVYTAIGDR